MNRVAEVNRALREAGIAAVLRRGRGYYYFTGPADGLARVQGVADGEPASPRRPHPQGVLTMPVLTGNRPYVIHVIHLASGSTHVERVTRRRAASLAKCHGLDRVGPATPRSSRTYTSGTVVEFRYVDPRAGAPDCISARTQEV